MDDIERVTIKRIIGPTPQGAAVLVGNEQKTFVVFVGPYEAAAMVREINSERLPRPLTHELVQSIFLGFDVRVKRVIVSDLADQTYFATLVLEQQMKGPDGQPTGQRQEVRIDARPSDCFVLALKNKTDIYVTRDVLDKVEDVAGQPPEFFGFGPLAAGASGGGVAIPDSLGDELETAFGVDSAAEDAGEDDQDEDGADPDEDPDEDPDDDEEDARE